MKNNKIVKLYRNIFEEGTTKGSFFITDSGLMVPRTRNITLWGMASSATIPPKYRKNSNIVTAIKGELKNNIHTQLPAFFKFQKEPVSAFTEALGMEISTYFNTTTSYNYPAHIDDSPNSLFRLASLQLDKTPENFGSLIFSFLAKDEELITFYKMASCQEMSVDVMSLSALVPSFLASNLPHLPPSEINKTALRIQQDYAYQYLLRDYLGDIDYTSKNSGIVINKSLGYAHLAPNFDFGESMNVLIANKFKQPKLTRLEDYDEVARHYMTQENIDKANNAKLKRYNTPVSELAKEPTFRDNSDINIYFICSAYPEVAETFREDLQSFTYSETLHKIIKQYTSKDGLITEEQGDMTLEYLRERSFILERKLEENLEFVPAEKRYNFEWIYDRENETQQDLAPYQSVFQQTQGEELLAQEKQQISLASTPTIPYEDANAQDIETLHNLPLVENDIIRQFPLLAPQKTQPSQQLDSLAFEGTVQ